MAKTGKILLPDMRDHSNKEHLAILRQGVRIWNKWRQRNPELKPDLSSARLQGANLRGADFSDMSLIGTDLSKADLSLSDFDGTSLNMVGFDGANLRGAQITVATIVNSSFRGADLTKADLHNSVFSSSLSESGESASPW